MQKKKAASRSRVSALSLRHRALGAPFVMTAVLAAGCEPVHTNPGPPTRQPAPTDTTPPTNPPAPTDTPTTNPPAPTATTTPPPPSAGALPDAPNDSSGSLAHRPDGTCVWVYKYEPMDCPPGDSCNPGPPRKPLAVKCPSGPSTKK